MKKSALVLIGFASLFTAQYAPAASLPPIPPRHQDFSEKHVNPDIEEMGVVSEVREDTRSITLASGHRFSVPAWIDMKPFKSGQTVSVTYSEDLHHGTTSVKSVAIM